MSIVGKPQEGAIPIAKFISTDKSDKDGLDKKHLYITSNRGGITEFSLKTYGLENKYKLSLAPRNIKNQMDVVYVAGRSGSGKSTFCARFIMNYLKENKDANFFIFSRVKADPAFDSFTGKKSPIFAEVNNESEIDISSEIPDKSVVLFDDIETIPDKSKMEATKKLLLDCIETGRHKRLCIVITSHLINGNDHKLTRSIMNELTSITFFPLGGLHQIDYALKKEFGMKSDQINGLMKIDSRWITICKGYPSAVLYETGVYII